MDEAEPLSSASACPASPETAAPSAIRADAGRPKSKHDIRAFNDSTAHDKGASDDIIWTSRNFRHSPLSRRRDGWSGYTQSTRSNCLVSKRLGLRRATLHSLQDFWRRLPRAVECSAGKRTTELIEAQLYFQERRRQERAQRPTTRTWRPQRRPAVTVRRTTPSRSS